MSETSGPRKALSDAAPELLEMLESAADWLCAKCNRQDSCGPDNVDEEKAMWEKAMADDDYPFWECPELKAINQAIQKARGDS